MPHQELYVSRAGLEELKVELERLLGERKDTTERIKEAHELGDLSENAEYQEARELQAATEERILKLESILQSAKIVDHKEGDTVTLGSTVVIVKEGDAEKHQYEIVGSEEADMQKRRISHLSPLGEALIGRSKGDTFSFDTPKGKMKYSVVEVK